MPAYSTPEGKFYQQSLQAKQRGIAWELTFEQWWAIWQDSGKWEQRGKRKGQYVMARRGDVGPYSVANVFVCTAEQNHSDANAARWAGVIRAVKEKRQIKGWTYRVGNKKPYQVVVGKKYIGVFSTQEEAEAAYAAAVAIHLSSFDLDASVNFFDLRG